MVLILVSPYGALADCPAEYSLDMQMIMILLSLLYSLVTPDIRELFCSDCHQ